MSLEDKLALLVIFLKYFSHTSDSIVPKSGSGDGADKTLPQLSFNDTGHLLWTAGVKCGFSEISSLKHYKEVAFPQEIMSKILLTVQHHKVRPVSAELAMDLHQDRDQAAFRDPCSLDHSHCPGPVTPTPTGSLARQSRLA